MGATQTTTAARWPRRSTEGAQTRRRTGTAGLLAAVLLTAVPALAHAAPRVDGGTVTDADVRFQVLTPSLVRLEHAPGGRFEDRPTMLAHDRARPDGRVTVTEEGADLVLTTDRLTLRYTRGTGAFTDANLDVDVKNGAQTIQTRPRWEPKGYTPPPDQAAVAGYFNPVAARQRRTQGNLGGWRRGLDNATGPVQMGDGVLSRDGWSFVDDTRAVLLQDGGRRYVSRAVPEGYQDGYLFGYGDDRRAALADLRRLSGATPLLPRKAFGVWFSRFAPFSEADYRERILPRFRAERVPLDVLVVDTEFRSPHPWAGWNWNPKLFPNPRRFTDWAHGEGLDVTLNAHPSIPVDDPKYPKTLQTAGGALPPSLGGQTFNSAIEPSAGPVPHSTFDWSDQRHLKAYFDLHTPFEADGADFWWLDHCCEEARTGPTVPTGEISGDTWINSQYARRSAERGSRWLPLSRIGASYSDWSVGEPGPWGAGRSAIHFTGDAQSTWEMLDSQTAFTAAEGAIGVPYVSHDIGGFGNGVAGGFGQEGEKLSDELYVRWIQSGAVQPILRLHSSNAGDPRRLPWEFTGKAREISAAFLRLRNRLVPYLYTAAEQAHRTGLPLTRAMHLDYPTFDEAYDYDRQYLLGPDLLAAPVGVAGDPATKEVWFPPGTWVDLFTGERHTGPRVEKLSVPLERMPLFAREGAILALALDAPSSERQPFNKVDLRVFGGADGTSKLYEDAEEGLAYRRGVFSRTFISHYDRKRRLHIGPMRGGFDGQVTLRRWNVEWSGVPRAPRAVLAGRKPLRRDPAAGRTGWSYDAASKTLRISARSPTAEKLRLRYR